MPSAAGRRFCCRWMWGPGVRDATDTDTAEILGLGVSTVERTRRAFMHQGLTAALQPPALDHPRRARPLDGAGEAELIKLACSLAPAGSSGWTLQLLAERLVELQVLESMGRETVRVALKKPVAALESPQLVPEDGAGTVILSALGRRSWILPTPPGPPTSGGVWTKSPRSSIRRCGHPCRPSPVGPPGLRVPAHGHSQTFL